jgi:hypothetical protein
MYHIYILFILLCLFIYNNKYQIENFFDYNYENVILIPYRKRKKHLDYFLKKSIPLFDKYLNNYKVVVIEQNNDFKFNRGILLNIGYDIFKNNTKYIFTHDVDLNPFTSTIKNLYNKSVKKNSIMGIYTSYCDTLGGIIKMRTSTFKKINGFPNNFWGWGLEDIELQNRAETFNLKITKNIKSNDPNRYKYFKIFNDVNDRNKPDDYNIKLNFIRNEYNKNSFEKKKSYILKSGLNNLQYVINDKIKLHDNVIKYKVNFEYI